MRLSSFRGVGECGLAAAALLVFAGVAQAQQKTGPAPTFTKDVAPIFQEKCEACHRPDSIAPMSLRDLRGVAPVGEVDQDARRRAADAAVAHRQDRRDSAVQERPVAERRADRHDRPLGRCRRAEGRPEGHAAARRTGPTSRPGTSPRCSARPSPISSSRSTPYTVSRARRRTPGGSRRSNGLTEPRWVRAIEIRPIDRQGPPRHAPRGRLPAAGRERQSGGERVPAQGGGGGTIRRCRRCSWNGRSASRARSAARDAAS